MKQIRKSILKTSLLVGGMALSCINLVSCNNSKKEFMEVGLDNQNNNMVQNIYASFYTGLKVKAKSNPIQKIEVFCWDSVFERYENILDKMNVIDKEQNLEFKLYREVYKYGNYREETKTIEIHSFTNTLEYFYSEEFDRSNAKSIIDTISVEDLYTDYIDYAGIRYYFIITPVEDETINIYHYTDEKITQLYESEVKSHNCSIAYEINKKMKLLL